MKLSPCVIGVAASGLELGEAFRPETFTTQHWATVRSHGRSPLPRLELCVQVGTVSSDVLCGSQGFFAWASPQRALRCETWWGLRTTEYFESIKIFQSSSKRIEPCKPKPLEPLFFEIRTSWLSFLHMAAHLPNPSNSMLLRSGLSTHPHGGPRSGIASRDYLVLATLQSITSRGHLRMYHGPESNKIIKALEERLNFPSATWRSTLCREGLSRRISEPGNLQLGFQMEYYCT